MIQKILTTVLLSLTALSAKADIIKCHFTEPFITTTYSMTQSTLTITNDPEGEETTMKNVSFQIKSAGIFELVSSDGKVLQELIINNEGSDGMSDAIYPYDVKDYTWGGQHNSPLRGGCSSNFLKGTTTQH